MIKVFDKWDVEGITIEDAGLKGYINLKPRIVPLTGATYAGKRFHKSKTFIVERLMNKTMVAGHKSKKHYRGSGHITGKSNNSYKLIKNVFEIIARKTKENPIKILVKAIENASPREEIIAIEYGGARYPQATDSSPLRRLNIALKNIVRGAHDKSFAKKKKIPEALADEIILASKKSNESFAITKKIETEKQADSAR